MSEGRKHLQGPRAVLCVAIGAVALGVASGSLAAQTSEIDSYDRAVTSQNKENALAFLREFRSSHLVVDLIESLRPDVAREVCASLPTSVSRARRACEQLRQAPAAAVSSGGDLEVTTPPSTSAAATQPLIGSPSSSEGATINASAPAVAPSTSVGSNATTGQGAASELVEPSAGGQGITAASAAINVAAPTQTAAAVPGFQIQLISTSSRAEAESAWQELQMAYPDLLRDLQFSISEVDFSATGGSVAYRGVAGPLSSRDEAKVLCIVIRSSPPYNDCFVVGN